MNDGDRNEPSPDLLRFLRSLQADPLPADLGSEQDETVILERLRLLADGDDGWIARNLEHARWITGVFERLNRGALNRDTRAARSPLGHALDGLAEEAANLGAWAGLAQCALDARDDLEPGERELLAKAVRDAGSAGTRAWARIDQARCLLATIGQQARA